MRTKILNILPWVFMIAAIILLSTFINRNVPRLDYKEAIKTKDETIRVLIKEREADRYVREMVIMELHRKDSLLQLKHKTIVIKNESIPVYVAGLSDSALRSAVEDFR